MRIQIQHFIATLIVVIQMDFRNDDLMNNNLDPDIMNEIMEKSYF